MIGRPPPPGGLMRSDRSSERMKHRRPPAAPQYWAMSVGAGQQAVFNNLVVQQLSLVTAVDDASWCCFPVVSHPRQLLRLDHAEHCSAPRIRAVWIMIRPTER